MSWPKQNITPISVRHMMMHDGWRRCTIQMTMGQALSIRCLIRVLHEIGIRHNFDSIDVTKLPHDSLAYWTRRNQYRVDVHYRMGDDDV